MTYHERYLVAAAVTLAVELPLVLLLARRARLGASLRRIAAAALAANLLTHPALWYVPYLLVPAAWSPQHWGTYVVGGEAAVLAVEALVYWLLLARRRPWLALALGTLANAASYGVGLLVMPLLH
ncbi:MAG: hypothetical protein QME96_15255 [Myxococcota bacterium]|nr:hypothetical protein [Myxococcota bacterium]